MRLQRASLVLLVAACSAASKDDSGTPSPVIEAWAGDCQEARSEAGFQIWLGFTSVDPAALEARYCAGQLVECPGELLTGTAEGDQWDLSGACNNKGACWQLRITHGETEAPFTGFYGGDGYGSTACKGTLTRAD